MCNFLARLLLHFMAVASLNCYEIGIYETVGNSPWHQGKPNSVGLTYQPTLALLNHSCDPSTIRFNVGRATVLVASRDIKKGEEVKVRFKSSFFLDKDVFLDRLRTAILQHMLKPRNQIDKRNLTVTCSNANVNLASMHGQHTRDFPRVSRTATWKSIWTTFPAQCLISRDLDPPFLRSKRLKITIDWSNCTFSSRDESRKLSGLPMLFSSWLLDTSTNAFGFWMEVN